MIGEAPSRLSPLPPWLSIFHSFDHPRPSCLALLQPRIFTHLSHLRNRPLRLPLSLSLSLSLQVGSQLLSSISLSSTILPGPLLWSSSLLQDSLDSPEDYVSCYYSSLRRGTPALLLLLLLLLLLRRRRRRSPLASVRPVSSSFALWLLLSPPPPSPSILIGTGDVVVSTAHEEARRRWLIK